VLPLLAFAQAFQADHAWLRLLAFLSATFRDPFYEPTPRELASLTKLAFEESQQRLSLIPAKRSWMLSLGLNHSLSLESVLRPEPCY